MSEVNFRESSFRFTSPIRFFKANDPYHHQVDNIPLRQLAENCDWLKDQLDKPLQLTEVSRSDFSELRPFVNGVDNKVRVKPGRFMARINDATRINQLQEIISQDEGSQIGEVDIWQVRNFDSLRTTLLNLANSSDPSLALGLNGLETRAFVYPSQDGNFPVVDYNVGPGPIFRPVRDIYGWPNFPFGDSYFINTDFDVLDGGFSFQGILDSIFIKYWRGVTRFAVVDVREELEIELEAFNEFDFDFTNEDGELQSPENGSPVDSRIDLVFIYSKPIDASSSPIIDAASGITNITQPTLGVLQGAGALIDFSPAQPKNDQINAIDESGKILMIADPSDQFDSDLGTSSIQGSFPAPDDLLNVAPLLSEKLEASHPSLVGQSILPVAYVRVSRNAPTNAAGKSVISSSDIIDIRPFFRTAELSYNERAGIAAARPALSISNPVVGKVELKNELKRIYNDYNPRLTALENNTGGGGGGGGTQPNTGPRVVSNGYVLGGMNYGVESVLGDFFKTQIEPDATNERLKALITQNYLFSPGSITIPDFPSWDVAPWAFQQGLPGPGQFMNDYIHVASIYNTENILFTNWKDQTRSQREGGTFVGNGNQSITVLFVKKTIRLDRSQVPWMGDYNVDVKFLNCFPLSTGGDIDGKIIQSAGANSVWVDKKQNEFTIYCAWNAQDCVVVGAEENRLLFETYPGYTRMRRGNSTGFNANNFAPPHLNRDLGMFRGWIVAPREITEGFVSQSIPFLGSSYFGLANYPSIQFTVTGIPSTFDGNSGNLANSNDQITLR